MRQWPRCSSSRPTTGEGSLREGPGDDGDGAATVDNRLVVPERGRFTAGSGQSEERAVTTLPPGAHELVDFRPAHSFFVGIDSDGCAFDAMEIKHKECFTPATIRVWGLQPVARAARETTEFVNLYSTTRGLNRWVALVRVFDLLRDHPEVATRGARIPSGDRLREFIASGSPLSAPGLATYAAEHPDPELDRALEWTQAVDDAIEAMVVGVPPFAWVRESLAAMRESCDLMVVSATPVPALRREWAEHGLAAYMDVIAGQEMGTKAQHLQYATTDKYADDHVLLIGDAPGDRDAAREAGVLYYPVNPGHEDESWRRLHGEALGRFLAGSYRGDYQDALVAEFEALLPDTPPWVTGAGRAPEPVPAPSGPTEGGTDV
jgi:phosphoglycolate phosphatase-like HAD superfamily hydrolase